MEKIGNSKNTFYVIAPFNSRMIFDYSSLIGKYEKIRKQLYLKLDKIYPDQVLIEKFKDDANPSESIKNWAKESEKVIQGEIDELLFKGTGGSGATKRDKSIITIQIKEKIELPENVIERDVFNSAPTVIMEEMSFHEYGIGMLYCKVNLSFKQDFMTLNPRKVMADLLDQILRTENHLKTTEYLSSQVLNAYNEILEEIDLDKPLMTYEDLFDKQKSGIPLWGHIVLVRNKQMDDEILNIDEIMKDIIEVSHPEGGINFAKGTKGFVHIGWGNSLWANLNGSELAYAKETLRFLEVEYRTLQVFNEFLTENRWPGL